MLTTRVLILLGLLTFAAHWSRLPIPPLAYYDRESVNKRIGECIEIDDTLRELDRSLSR